MVRHTGYGRVVSTVARKFYGIEEITLEALEAASHRTLELRRPGERLRLLKDAARLDHVQIDNFCWPCLPDPSGLDFFLYDVSGASFLGRDRHPSLGRGDGRVRAGSGKPRAGSRDARRQVRSVAIALKSAHAYGRTLFWQPRDPGDVSRSLQTILTRPDGATEADHSGGRLVFGPRRGPGLSAGPSC